MNRRPKRPPRPSRQWQAPRNPKTLDEQQERWEEEMRERQADYYHEERDPLEEMRQ
jgi:hypothetical protein